MDAFRGPSKPLSVEPKGFACVSVDFYQGQMIEGLVETEGLASRASAQLDTREVEHIRHPNCGPGEGGGPPGQRGIRTCVRYYAEVVSRGWIIVSESALVVSRPFTIGRRVVPRLLQKQGRFVY